MIAEEKPKYLLGLLRISMGLILLWAFFDKLFGFGFATLPNKSWLAGNSPTSGFLLNAVHGPFAEFFKSLAGNVWIDWIFMLGLLLIGLSFWSKGNSHRLQSVGEFRPPLIFFNNIFLF